MHSITNGNKPCKHKDNHYYALTIYGDPSQETTNLLLHNNDFTLFSFSAKEMLRNPKLPVKEISSPVLHLIAANSVCSFVCTSFSVLEGLILTTTFKKFLKLTKSRQTFYSDY